MNYQKLTVGLLTYSLPKTIEFYTAILEFNKKFESQGEVKVVSLEKDNVRIVFQEVVNTQLITPIGIGLHGNNPEELYQQIKNKVSFKNDLDQCVEGGFSILDNNGNEITFYPGD